MVQPMSFFFAKSELRARGAALRGMSAAAAVSILCAGCAPALRVRLHEIAVEAVKADEDFPSGAVLRSKSAFEFYIGRNAACFIAPYEYVDANGARHAASHTVWLKRVGTRWKIDRLFPTPEPERPRDETSAKQEG